MNNIANDSSYSTHFQQSTAARVLDALAPYELSAERGNGQYRCNSPLRPGSNSHAFTLIIHDAEHGAYMDHVSEESGTLYELAARLGIETPAVLARQPIETTKRVYSGLGDYALAHGLTEEVFKSAGWSETAYQGRPALAFNTQTGTRYRFLDGDKPTYKSPFGYERCWYGLQRAVQLAKETAQPLIICNGEASTVVGQHFGVAACAVTGGEKKAMPTALLDELKAAYDGPVLVAFDCLDKGADAAPLLADQLRAAGITARAIDLGLGKGGDLADFCHLYVQEAVAALAQLPDLTAHLTVATAALPAAGDALPTSRWQWMPADDLDTLPPIKWLIPDEIPEEALVVLFGPSGVGKSFIALDYSLQIAQQHPVLYIAAEGHRGYASRKIAWCKHHGLGSGQLYFPTNNAVVALLDPATVQEFIASVTLLHPKLIVFDTLAWCMTGGEENSASDMQQLITHCRQIQTSTGTTVMLVHHTGKNGTAERGSSALRGGADMMIELFSDDDLVTLSCSKSKDTEGFADRRLSRRIIETRPGETSCVWLPTERVAYSKADKLTRQQRAVLETLAAPLFSEVGARFAQLADALPDICRSGLYKILNRLMDSRLGYIGQGKKGEPFTITEAGRAALAGDMPGTPTRLSTESTGSLPESTPVLNPLSTVSTPPTGGGQGQTQDTQIQPITPASPPVLPADAQAALAALGDKARLCPREFLDAREVLTTAPDAVRTMLTELVECGCIEQDRPTSTRYRLTPLGWQVLNKKIVTLNLRDL